MFGHIRHIHFVGIGGSGMSGIAEVLLNLGYVVSGSDQKRSASSRSRPSCKYTRTRSRDSSISKKRRMPDGGQWEITVLRGLRGEETAVGEGTKGLVSPSGWLRLVLLCFDSDIVMK